MPTPLQTEAKAQRSPERFLVTQLFPPRPWKAARLLEHPPVHRARLQVCPLRTSLTTHGSPPPPSLPSEGGKGRNLTQKASSGEGGAFVPRGLLQ